MPTATMPWSVTISGFLPPRLFRRSGIWVEQFWPTRVTVGMKKDVIWPICMLLTSVLIVQLLGLGI